MILDTCLVTELWKRAPDAGVTRWFASADEGRLFLSALTVGELAEGASRLPEGLRRRGMEERLVAFRRDFAARILPIDDAVAARWGRLRGEQSRAGRVLPVVDSLLAATALVHAMPIVTRNEADFAGLGVEVLNPWAAR